MSDRYEKPAEGSYDGNWHEPLNRNWNDIGADVDALEEGYINPTTMYVRSGGSDANDGLTATTAKATPNAAIADAPVNGDSDTPLRIDIGTGTFPELTLTNTALPVVYVVGSTDANGIPDTTISASTGVPFTCHVSGQSAKFTNINFSGGETGLRATDRANVWVDNCTASGSTGNTVEVFGNSRYRDEPNCHFDQSSTTGDVGCLRVYSSVANLQGRYEGDGGGFSVIQCWANATVYISDTAEIIGEGSAATDSLIDARDLGHVKAAGAWTAQGAREIFRVRNGALVKLNDAPTTTDVSRRWDIWDGGTGIDDSQAEAVGSVPKMNGVPEGMREANTGAREGWIVFDRTAGQFKGYNGAEWIVLG